MKEKDWRITNQKKYLTNVKLINVDTSKIKCDHEHCVFCWDKFLKNENIKMNVYATTNLKYWICEKCFNDFRKEFDWIVVKPEDIQGLEQV